MMAQNKIIFFYKIIFFGFLLNCIRTNESSDKLKANLIEKFKSKFFSFVSQYYSGKNLTEISELQIELLKLRNYECPKEHAHLEALFDKSKKSSLFELVVAKIYNISDQVEQNNEDEIVDNIDKICLDSETISSVFNIANFNSTQNNNNIGHILLNQFINEGCDLCKKHSVTKHTRFATWMYGLIAALIVTISSLAGSILYPLERNKHFAKILMFLMAVAIGTLIGTSIIHLIPHAFGISDDVRYSLNDAFIWKALAILCGLYLFFIIEQFLKLAMNFKKKKAIVKNQTPPVVNNFIEMKPLNAIEEESGVDQTFQSSENENKLSLNNIHSSRRLAGSQINLQEIKNTAIQTVAPVAYIILCGEALHNLLDGLSIGAAYSETFLKGASLSLAIICEEFPHKLGDFAILLASGLTFKKALFFNFLASALIFVGVALGITLGENLNVNQWIYAFAAGMFLYVSVCDMIPELEEKSDEIMRESIARRQGKHSISIHHTHSHGHSHAKQNNIDEDYSVRIRLRNMAIQHLGLMTGFTCMLLIALYADKISL